MACAVRNGFVYSEYSDFVKVSSYNDGNKNLWVLQDLFITILKLLRMLHFSVVDFGTYLTPRILSPKYRTHSVKSKTLNERPSAFI